LTCLDEAEKFLLPPIEARALHPISLTAGGLLQALTQGGVKRPDCVSAVGFMCGVKKRPQFGGEVTAHSQDTQAVTMQKFKTWIMGKQFSPQLVDVKAALPHLCVVKQHNGARR